MFIEQQSFEESITKISTKIIGKNALRMTSVFASLFKFIWSKNNGWFGFHKLMALCPAKRASSPTLRPESVLPDTVRFLF